MPPPAAPALEQRAFALAALLGPWTRTQLAEWLQAMQVRMPPKNPGTMRAGRLVEGPLVSATDLAPIVEAWEGQQRLQRFGQAFRVQPNASHHFLSAAHNQPLLAELATHFPTSEVRVQDGRPIYRASYRDDEVELKLFKIRLALYLHRPEHALTLFEDVSTLLRVRGEAFPIVRLFPVNSHSAAPALLPEDLYKAWVQAALAQASSGIRMPSESLLQRLLDEDHVFPLPWREEAGVLLALSTCPPQLDQQLRGLPTATGLCARAVVALRQGRWEEARALVHEACDASRGPTGKRKPRLEGFAAPLMYLVLATGGRASRALLAQLQDSARKKRDQRFCARLLSQDRKQADDDDAVELYEMVSGEHLDMAVPALVAEALWPRAMNSLVAQAARNVQQRFADAGYTYFAEQAQKLVPVFELRNQRAAAGYKLPDGEGEDACLTGLSRSVPAWQRALDALEALEIPQAVTPPGSVKDGAARARLVFCLTPTVDGSPSTVAAAHAAMTADEVVNLRIEPRLQKRQSAGWSAGRPVALKKLAEGIGVGVELSAADKALAVCIESHRTWSAGWEHTFSQTAAVALVGHPLVFWDEAFGAGPVEIVAGVPSLQLERTAKGLTLKVIPLPNPTGVAIAVEGLHRVRVLLLSKQQLAAINVARSLPLMPIEAEARLGQVLARLSPLFTIHSDVQLGTDSASVAEVPAIAQAVLYLSRAHPGVKAKLVIEPLGPMGPQVQPGRGLENLSAEVGDQRVRCKRNLNVERANAQRLEEEIPELAGVSGGAPIHIEELGACLQVLKRLLQLEQDAVVTVRWADGEPIEYVGEVSFANLALQVQEAGQWLSVSGHVQVNEDLVLSMSQLLAKDVLATGYVDLGQSRFMSLLPSLVAQLAGLRAAAEPNEDPEAPLRLPPASLWFAASWLREVKEGAGLAHNTAAGRRIERIEAAYQREPHVPATLEASLRPYQEDGFAFLSRIASFGGGAILADDMGLGKTLMTLALLVERGVLGPALVVAPVSVKNNWVQEAQRFAPSLRFVSLADAQEASTDGTVGKLLPFDVLVCSYTVMANAIAALETITWSTLVLDEAQAVKNPVTQRAKAARRLVADTRCCLTGTPIENHLGDLFSIMSIANPGLLGSAKSFEARFAKPIQKEGDQVARQGLQALISPFVLRRRKAQVLRELPARTEIVYEVEVGPEERAFVEALRRAALQRVTGSAGKLEGAVSILAEITRLRRAACHPKLVAAEAEVGSAKLDALMTLLADLREGQHRALIFSQFVDFLALVKARLEAENISFQYLDGSSSEKNRTQAVANFQAGQGEVFLISLKAGGFGLNLTAADYVVHLDPWWNPAVEDQASDRAHRIGQTRPVTIYRLVNKGSIEEKVLSLHARKRELAEDLLRETNAPAKLDVNALLALLE